MAAAPNFYERVRTSIAEALDNGLGRGFGLSWTVPVAAFALVRVFALGDVTAISDFLVGIGGGLIGDTLRDWAMSGRKPQEDEIAALIQEAVAGRQAPEGVLRALDERIGLLETVLRHAETEQLPALLAPHELEMQSRLFGADLRSEFGRLMAEQRDHLDSRFDRLEANLALLQSLLLEGRRRAGNGFITQEARYGAAYVPFPTLLDPLAEGGQPILVCRKASLEQLDGWLDAVCRAPAAAHHLAVVTGAAESGKHDLLRTWLAGLAARPNAPAVACITFLPPYIPEGEQAHFYRTHAGWQLAWDRYGEEIRRLFPTYFKLGSYPWVLMAVQLAAQSERARRLLAPGAGGPGMTPLQYEPPLDSPELRRTLSAILGAAASERPLVVVLEHVDQAGATWMNLLNLWPHDLVQQPVLFVAAAQTPFPLHDERLDVAKNRWLGWLRELTGPSSPRAHLLPLGRLTRWEVEELLAAGASGWAADLHYLTGGAPAILRELLGHWRSTGDAVQEAGGRWRLRFDPQAEARGSLTLRLIGEPLLACAGRAQALGFDVTADELAGWLRLAAWEGDVFTDEALALALGRHGEGLEAFQEILDSALRIDDAGQGVLEELEEAVTLPTAGLDRPFRSMARYRVAPPVLGRILHGLQSESDRRAGGLRYAEALAAAYAPFLEMVAPQLIATYEALGEKAAVQAVRDTYFVPDPVEEAMLAAMRAIAVDPSDKRILLRRLLAEYDQARLRRHPGKFLAGLHLAETLAGELGDAALRSRTLYYLGMVYSDLGEKRKALEYYEKALPLFGQVGNKSGEASTLTNIGTVYYALGEQQKALDYLEPALPLLGQVGDKGGEAATLNNIGNVHHIRGEQQKALDYLERALPLLRQVGNKSGEAATLTNIGGVYSDLGEQQNALDNYKRALPLHRQVGDKGGEAATLNNIGSVHHHTLGEQQKALENYERALLLFRQVGDKGGEAATLNNIGNVHHIRGEQQKALDYYEQALPLQRHVEDRFGESFTHFNIARAAAAIGDLDRAVAELERAVAIDEAVGHPNLTRDRTQLERVLAQRDSRSS